MTLRLFVFLLSLFSLTALPAQAGQVGSLIVGWVEKVHIDSIDTTFTAKLDTGATTSSLDAEIIKLTETKEDSEGNHGHVVFSVKDESGEARVVERKIRRWVRIKSKAGGFFRRPVINMTFCIAGREVKEEVNLSPRGHFVYPVLIGRNMLSRGALVIDSGKKFTGKPACLQKI